MGRVLVLLLALLGVAELVVVHQVSERLGGDGHHVGQDHSAVTAAREQQLVMRVIIPHTPHPETAQHTHHSITHSSSNTAASSSAFPPHPRH